MATIRTVTGTVLHLDGTPMVDALVLFELVPGSYTLDSQFPREDHTALTNEDGEFSVLLWANEEGVEASEYVAQYPNGESFHFLVPPTGPTDIGTLRGLYPGPSNPNLESILDYTDSHLGGRPLDNETVPAVDDAYRWNGSEWVPVPMYTKAEANALFLDLPEADVLFLTQAEGDARYSQLGHTHAAGEITGNITYAQLPTGSGAWDAGVGNTVTLTRAVAMSSTLAVTGTVTGGTYNGQTITSAASFTGSVAIATTLAVTGTSTLTGNVAVGGAVSADFALRILTATLTGTTQRGLSSKPVFSSAATVFGQAAYAQAETPATTFTMAAAADFYAANPIKGSGSTITVAYGYFAEAITAGSTNWAFFSTGSTQSAFGGNVSIGKTTTPSVALDLNGAAAISQTLAVTGDSTLTGNLRVNGTVAIGNAVLPNAALRIAHSALTGTAQIGIYNADSVFTSAATASMYALYVQARSAAATYTTTTVYGLAVQDVNKGAGHTITTQYGVYVNALAAGATNFAVFTSGTTPSAFGGNVRIGSGTVPTVALDVVGTVNATAAYQRNGTQVVAARVTGYTNAMTGTANRATAYATGTITLPQLAERFKALQDDLTTHGLIGV